MLELRVPHRLRRPAAGWPPGLTLAAAYAAALLVCAAVATHLQALAVGFSGADESAHFLNAFFVHEYLGQRFGWQPLAAAQEFYLHYPKLSIGQWPPLHYAILGALFAVVPPTPGSAMALNLLASALPVLFVAAVSHRLAGALAAVGAAVWYATLPVVLQAMLFFMTDQAVTLWVCAAAAAWVGYAARPTLAGALLFAALAAAAVLTKGNGWQAVLVPPVHLALTRRLRLLADWRLYVSAAVGLAALVPWYLVTLRLTSDSWFFEPGWAYARLAAVHNAGVLAGNLGGAGLALAGLGAASAWRRRGEQPQAWSWAAVCVALATATFVFQAAAPAGLEARFMAPALPALVVLTVLGLRAAGGWLQARLPRRVARGVLAALALTLALPGYRFSAAELPKVDLRLAPVAEAIVAAPAPSIWLVDGSAGAEGALIAQVAARDAARGRYLVRASQLLADSNWTGQRYRLRTESPADAARALGALGVRGVVLVRRATDQTQPHSHLLAAALADPGSGYRLVQRLEHLNRVGATELYEAVQPPAPDLDRLRAISAPSKARALVGATHSRAAL